jgi:hypothetical protein
MWAGVEIARPIRILLFVGAKKVMICVYFSPSGIENVILLLPKEILGCEFFVENFWPILAKNKREIVSGNVPGTLSSILTISLLIEHRVILIASKSEDFFIC